MHSKPSLGQRLLQSLLSPFVKRAAYRQNPQWDGCAPDDLIRIDRRLTRFAHAYRQKYRAGGNLMLPLDHRMENGRILTAQPDGEAQAFPAAMAAQTLEPAQVDTLMRTLLAQLAQLESLDFVHGALHPDHLLIVRRDDCFAARLGGIHHARFTDEPVSGENLFSSPYMSPETHRRAAFPGIKSAPPDSDIFSAGCLYHLLLTGEPLTVCGRLHPAQAVCSALPLPIQGVGGVRASLLRWMLSPLPADRPSAAQALAAINEAGDAGLLDDGRPGMTAAALAASRREASFAGTPHPGAQSLRQSRDGRWHLYRRLDHMWQASPMPSGAFFSRQLALSLQEQTRLGAACSASAQWHQRTAQIAQSRLIFDDSAFYTVAPLPENPVIELGALRDYDDSLFLLDARMTELLFLAQTLHNDNYLLGMFSQSSFLAEITDTGARVHLVDLSGVMPMDPLPAPFALLPDGEQAMLLSPELAQYISAQSQSIPPESASWISSSSDIFALGLIYHLILFGSFPKIADPRHPTFGEAVASADSPEQALVFDPRLDARRRALIVEMLSFSPLDRPPRCDSIAYRIMDLYTE